MMKLLNSNSIAGFVVGSAVCLTACLSIGSSDSEKVKEQRPVVSSVTMSPDIPSSVSFCGKDIDLTRYNMHEGFDRELSSFTYFHSTTMLLIKRANRCFPIIEPILKANGIPDDFKYLGGDREPSRSACLIACTGCRNLAVVGRNGPAVRVDDNTYG